MSSAHQILDFWFGNDLNFPGKIPAERFRLWFGGETETDRKITALFAEAVESGAAGAYNSWAETAQGRLALLVLLDQFPRNLFRGTARAFAYDAQALSLCLEGLDAEHDLQLSPVARAFFYLPLEHSETLAHQDRCVGLFRALLDVALPVQRAAFESFLDYAERHQEIIARFGRFPHRNKMLGRESTTAELEFLKLPGSSF